MPVKILSTQDNAKLPQQVKPEFRRRINCNKYQSHPKAHAQNKYLNHLVKPSFQGINRLFALSFENVNDRTSPSTSYLPKVEIKDCKVRIDGKNFFDQQIKNELKTCKYIRNIEIGKGYDYTTGCLWGYSYFKENYKMIAIDLSKQHVPDADPRAFQQINFTENLDRTGNTAIFLTIKESKETVLDFWQETVNVLWLQFLWVHIPWVIWLSV